MINFMQNPTKVRILTLDGISLGRKKSKIRLVLKDRTKGLVLILTNIFYFFHSPSTLVSLDVFNNAQIYHHNKDQILYNPKTQKTFLFAKRYKTSFFLYPFNLLMANMNILKNHDIYKKERYIN